MKPIHKVIAFTSLLVLPFTVASQFITFPINQHNGQNIETCSAWFTDSSGDTLSYYQNNEDYSVTFSSDDPDQNPFVKIDFLFLELGDSDTLTIYDGSSTADAILWEAIATDISGESIWSNTGSLHVRFVSSPADSARGWLARVSCFDTCDAFYTQISTQTGSFDFCPEETTASFTAQAAYYGGNVPEVENATYEWNFSGEPKTGPIVNQTYPGPGAYPFTLTTTDTDRGCVADTLITVRLATIPNFNSTILSADTICAEEPLIMAGSANPVTWTGFDTGVADTAFIDDTAPYTSELNFDVFPNDQQIVFADDLDRICVKLEHEDFGNLSMTIECPNGSTALLTDFGFGGANLGEPVVFGPADLPGKGYEYCFSPNALFGLMSETAFQFHSYTDAFGDLYNNASYLPQGSYLPVETFQSMIGCPFNGTWTLNVTDSTSGTSGHVMGWSLFFDDIYYPDSLIFTPEIVNEQWFDNDGNELNGNPATATISTEGEHKFTFKATDNFGCTWDTTLVVQVLPLPKGEITSEWEIPICEEDSTLLTVVAEIIGEELNWVYQWMLEGVDLEGRTSDTIMAKQVANYMVLVTDTITGCSDFFELSVTDQNCDLTVPNVFTPNGDGMNDVFEIQNLEYYESSVMVIYNRNGKKIFESTNYYLDWWDGGNHPDGTYYYVITYKRMGKEKQTHGVITILGKNQ